MKTIYRIELVNIVIGGMAPFEFSHYVKESKHRITLWVKTADEKGFEVLILKKQTGRCVKLFAEQLAYVKDVLAQDNPKAYCYSFWDRLALSNYIKNIDLCVRQCQRISYQFDFSPVRLHTYPSKDKPELEELKEEFKQNSLIEKRSQRRHCVLEQSAFSIDIDCCMKMDIEEIKSEGLFCSFQKECILGYVIPSEGG